ncbi:MAG: RluA family pseudouridine synthase [bacterium]|nr:RluA family pseudouridine synthase [bacterium]
MSNFTIDKSDANKRLDKFLNEKIEFITRSQIQKLIKNEGVLVNGEKTSVHHFLKVGDEVRLVPPKEAKVKDNKVVIDKKTSAPKFKFKVIKKTKDYLVIEKPAGLLVHEAPGYDETTLVNLVTKKYPDIKKVGDDPLRPGIVHRLDREVSGLMVIARTLDMFEHLKQQFKKHETKKEYIALVYGTPQKDEGVIKFNIDRSETKDYKMAAVPEHEDRGRKAVTDFELIEKIGKYSLMKLTPHTGRTHQIRVHLNAYGLPIVGDLVYRPKKLKVKIKMQRIFLHAQLLGFNDLAGQWQEYESKLPKELTKITKNLKNS